MGYTRGPMPWQTITPMEETNRFVILAQSGRFSVTDLCEQFGISRKTGYKHLERYAALGLAGLQDRKSTRLNSSHGKLSRMPSSA